MPGLSHAKRILVVDDEPLMREFLKEVLTRKHYRVEVSGDGEDALSMLEKDRFALVLTDWRIAPVKAPRSCPNSSLSKRVSGSAAQSNDDTNDSVQ